MGFLKLVGAAGALISLLAAVWTVRVLNTAPLASQIPAKHLTLADGRNLCYHSQGNPSNPHLIIYIHGTPSSRLESVGTSEEVLNELGFYMVSMDKPGYGQSHPDVSRTLKSFTDDVVALTDHLGVSKFFVVASSGGGPYGWACIKYLPDRVRGLLTISAAGPVDKLSAEEWAATGQPGFAMVKRLEASSALAAGAIRAMKTGLYRFASTDLGSKLLYHLVVKAAVANNHRSMADADEKCLQRFPEYRAVVVPEGLIQESAAVLALDIVLGMGTWPFNVSSIPPEVGASVHIWHGTGDKAVPYLQAHKFHDMLPSAHLHIVPDGGHFAYYVCNLVNQRKALSDLLKYARL
ncbi:hypothetical protein WJX72_009415 [[Myrmecia] bisecta]|uniref:AB hydrolase-1 domain-containing protein n=1 Tax=[Myrmecia] bisecta TaxID=41462 RepID=A0AAW1QS87_9CHLO